ncbi:MAG: helix-turn-helix transcriptional regulator [Clostridiales bacterium]|nr:helix-turn-helix transcriptional regulator [Clostridiales bacterium]
MEHMGDRIKRLREEKGLTQQELANLVGLDNRNSLSRYENGTRVPNPDIIIKLARVLDTTSDYLISAYIPDKLSNGDPVTELDIKEYDDFVKKASAFFMDDDVSDMDKEALFRDISELFWKSRGKDK